MPDRVLRAHHPGPLTTQPITARREVLPPQSSRAMRAISGIFARTCSCTDLASSWNSTDVVRPQPGHAVTSGVNAQAHRLQQFLRDDHFARAAILTAAPASERCGSLSPMPSSNSTASAALRRQSPCCPSASVRPRCDAWSQRAARSPMNRTQFMDARHLARGESVRAMPEGQRWLLPPIKRGWISASATCAGFRFGAPKVLVHQRGDHTLMKRS